MTEPELRTERLRMVPIWESDVDDIAALYADPEVVRYLIGRVSTRAEAVGWVQRNIAKWEQERLGMWRVEELVTGAFVGRCGLWPFDEDGQPPKTAQEIEVGYALHTRFWGRGYATAAARASVRYGFEVLGVDHIAGITRPENVASQRVLINTGLTYRRNGMFYGHDSRYFAVEREDWDGGRELAGEEGVKEGLVGFHELLGQVGEADQAELMSRRLGEAGDPHAAQREGAPIDRMDAEVGLLQHLDGEALRHAGKGLVGSFARFRLAARDAPVVFAGVFDEQHVSRVQREQAHFLKGVRHGD